MQTKKLTPKGDPILTNKNGVIIQYIEKSHHAHAINAVCYCGCELLVSPAVFHDTHEKGNPVLRCSDHGIHAYRFNNLELNSQKKENEELYKQSREAEN